MTDGTVLSNGPADSPATLVFAHGAGAPMDSPSMNLMAEAIARAGVRVLRFEFAYMAARRTGAGRRPPPPVERLEGEFLETLATVDASAPLVIGGKSMGGRVASMVADDLFDQRRIAGLFCAGYPFHPVARPEKTRTAHLEGLRTPTLICQGTRDPFGSREEVAAYRLSPAIELRWFEDGDHDLKPRRRTAGVAHADHMASMGIAVAHWVDRLLAK